MPNPYIVGTPVKGDRFYGREELLRQVLDSGKNCYFLLASRRYGKTSFLRQLEYLADTPDSAYLPLFWNLEGSEDEEILRLSLVRAVLGARQRLTAVGM